MIHMIHMTWGCLGGTQKGAEWEGCCMVCAGTTCQEEGRNASMHVQHLSHQHTAPTAHRKSKKCCKKSLSVSERGVPSTRATMLQLKRVCRDVCLKSAF